MFSSFSFSFLQLSFSQLSLLLWPPLSFLPSKPHAQLDVTSPLLPTRLGAATPSHSITVFYNTALQAY